MSSHYYIQNIKTGLYYNNTKKWPIDYWKQKPRIFSSLAGLKNSIRDSLMYENWYALPKEEQERRLALVNMHGFNYNYVNNAEERAVQISKRRLYEAVYTYWQEIKHKSLFELILPPLVLHTIEIGE